MRKSTCFEQWVEEYKDEPEYILHGLLYDITDEICRVMQERGLTRSDLAQRLGVSRQYVTKFLNTPQNTRLETVVRFATALGLTVKISLHAKADEMQPGKPVHWVAVDEDGIDEFLEQKHIPLRLIRKERGDMGDEPRQVAA